MKQVWQFNSVMNCDKCKFKHQCNMEPDCPYIVGWEDGQHKMLNFLIKYAHHAKLMTVEVVMKQKLEDMLKTLTMDKSVQEAADGKLIDRGSFAKYVEGK